MTGGIVFDNTINLGNVLTIIGGTFIWAITLAVAWTKLGGRLTMLEFRIKLVEDALKSIGETLKKFSDNEKELALLKAEVAAIQLNVAGIATSVEGLRRGEGYINQRRQGLDGEYN